jgi:hypothetical protein
MGWPDRLRELHESGWKPVGTGGFAGAAAFALYCAWFANSGEGWVHVLDGANLAFHEAGHPIFGLLLGPRIMVYGGTLGQLAFPLVVIGSFWARRETASFAIGLLWLAENLWNIARYMADARTRVLPLVGGGEHDWTEILTRWGALQLDTTLAGIVRLVAWLGVLATLGWLAWRWNEDRQYAD